MPMENIAALTTDNITAFLLVLVALAGLFILFANVVESFRKLHKPKEKQGADLALRITECDRKFANDLAAIRGLQTEIDGIKKSIASQGECNRMLIGGVHALLEHELHNGNATEMRDASKDMFDYLNTGDAH